MLILLSDQTAIKSGYCGKPFRGISRPHRVLRKMAMKVRGYENKTIKSEAHGQIGKQY